VYNKAEVVKWAVFEARHRLSRDIYAEREDVAQEEGGLFSM